MAIRPKAGGLGKGLGALFQDYNVTEMENNSNSNIDRKQTHDKEIPLPGDKDNSFKPGETFDSQVVLIDINDIKPNGNQPRKNFDPEKILELAFSIREHGVIQPLLLRRNKTGYEIVAGERRWRAAREAGLKKVPCILKELSDQENMLVAIIENMQREDLNPVEEAEGINQMIKTYELTQEEVSKSLGKSRPYITNALRILSLPKEALDCLASGKISSGHARALLSIAEKNRQEEILKRIIKEGLSVRDVEKLAKEGKALQPKTRGRKMEKNRDILAVEQDLKEIFGTKVSIVTNGKKGAVQIEYYSIEELNRIIDMLKTIK